jgi:hypothetical protein
MRRFSAESAHPSEVKYFTGIEALGKHTKGLKFLGVRGLQPVEEVIQKAADNQVQAILIGANKTFWPSSVIEGWDEYLIGLLTRTRYTIILSMNVNDTGLFDLEKYTKYGRFYIQLFVTAINVEKLPPDSTLVIEDRMWEQNNRCLYSVPFSEIYKSENAVSWDKIALDSIIEKDSD